MISASEFRLETINGRLTASCKLAGPGLPKRLWFMAESDDENALDITEPNWAAVAMLYPAMVHNQDLYIEADISPLLLHNLNNDIQILLKIINPHLNQIKVIAGSSKPQEFNKNVKRHVITGFSGGVDSTATYLKYNNPNSSSSLRLSALSIYDVGAIGKTSPSPSFEHLQKHFDQLKRFCDEKELLAFGVSSNMDQVYRSTKKKAIFISTFGFFPKYVSLVNISATLAMKKRVRLYLPSGTTGYSDMQFKGRDSTERSEPILAPLLSTERFICQPGAAGLTRFEKTKYIFETEPKSQLNVCIMKASKRNDDFLNCGRCWKCVETLYDIEAIGKLEEISTIFDLNEYNNNKDQLFELLILKRSLNLPQSIKNIPLIEAKGGKIPKILLEYQNSPQNDTNAVSSEIVKRKKWFFR
ncbi:hypothetical protein N9809_07900 [Amylibacter sp.]|nr:hypothetical protein [Amylibacter sp.]